MEDRFDRVFEKLSEEARELYLSKDIPVLDSPPTPLTFLREYVSKNRPVIIRNALDNWPALLKWTNDYLKSVLGSTQVTVTVTPDGYADAPVGEFFALPEERLMEFSKFVEIWEKKSANGVFYVQKQNSNFTDEFDKLLKDADHHVSWASEAFGTDPDAVNIWMGNSESVTSMHKDHYENLYAVVRGQKTFILHPPTDIHCIPYKTYKLAQYKENVTGTFDLIELSSKKQNEYKECNNDIMSLKINGSWSPDYQALSSQNIERFESSDQIVPKEVDCDSVSWIAIDPLKPDLKRYPQYAKCEKYIAKVEEGQLLYLPSLWFHHVTQADQTIAVNFWYDMEYDIKYNYFKFAEEVSNIVSSECDS